MILYTIYHTYIVIYINPSMALCVIFMYIYICVCVCISTHPSSSVCTHPSSSVCLATSLPTQSLDRRSSETSSLVHFVEVCWVSFCRQGQLVLVMELVGLTIVVRTDPTGVCSQPCGCPREAKTSAS